MKLTAAQLRAIPEESRPIVKVLLDGADVTNLCRAADNDPENGWVVLYKLNPQGEKYIEHGEVATETRYGRVKILAD